jgi:hypothetical protein
MSKRSVKRDEHTRINWCERRLMTSPYHFGLCLSEADFQHELRRLKVPAREWPDFLGSSVANATCHFLERTDGKRLAIICLGDTEGRLPVEVNGLLVHEAVHIWQRICEDIGERRPSTEFEAYSIQFLSQELMHAYNEATKKAGKTRKR